MRKIAAGIGSVIVAIGSCTAHAEEAYRFVSTRSGQIQGVVGPGVVAYKGIPYAAPPVGPLRWRPPAPPVGWSDIFVADRYGPACVQPSIPGRAKQERTSEDCLTLNVFAPNIIEQKLPVMVWIHGGSFMTGAGGNSFYDGSLLARQGVVVVTINYRLGRLGWFAHPALTKAAAGEPLANYGMLDQIAALQWVRDNIGAFGGDPGNVTAFGESAGGMSINMLMLCGAAKGLFQKAIVESGLGREPAHSLSEEERMGSEFARSLGIADDDLAGLRRIAPETVVEGGKSPPKGALAAYGPIMDGQLVEENVAIAFKKGAESKIPYMIGTNDNEATLFPKIRSEPRAVLGARSADLDQLRDHYPESEGSESEVAAKLVTDEVFTEPARFLARNHAVLAPTFRYYFAYVPQEKRQSIHGAGHGAEIQFVFGNLGARGGGVFSDADKNTSEMLVRYWTNFAKSGSPNGSGLPRWPRYKAGQDATLLIRNDGVGVDFDPQGSRLDVITARATSPQP